MHCEKSMTSSVFHIVSLYHTIDTALLKTARLVDGPTTSSRNTATAAATTNIYSGTFVVVQQQPLPHCRSQGKIHVWFVGIYFRETY